MRGATGGVQTAMDNMSFQSTPLMRGATSPGTASEGTRPSFNPRPSCEGRHVPMRRLAEPVHVSIHAPHARGDQPRPSQTGSHRCFNPRPSCEGRPLSAWLNLTLTQVSIHAPHARGDRRRHAERATTPSFNPRPSCEGRPLCRRRSRRENRFNPRPSCEGRLGISRQMVYSYLFQSTPLMRGAT